MNIKTATAKRLLSLSELTAITSTRIYRGGRLPKDQALQPPHVIIWLLSKDRIYDHDGYTGLTEAPLQISCFSRDPDEADTMARIVRQSMEAWPGEGPAIDSAFIEDESDLYEQETLIHHVPLDVSISYHEKE